MKPTLQTKFHGALAGIAMVTAGALHAEVPTPAPTFAVAPTSGGEYKITMTATVPASPATVEYLFTNTTTATDSGWQSSPTYTEGGLAAGTSYTYTVRARDAAVPLDETADSAGSPISTDADNGSNALIYEPFGYDVGVLNGASGPCEFGLDGSWSNGNNSSMVVASSLPWGPLPTDGGAIGNLGGGSNRFGGSRVISASTLAGNGLLDDGAILWFSAIVGYDIGGNRTNSRLLLVLGDESLNTGNFNYWMNGSGTTGLGVTMGRFSGGNGKIVATQARDTTFGDGTAGNVYGDGQGTGILPGSPNTAVDAVLVVGKITWAEDPADPDLVELFLPSDLDLAFPDPLLPHSSLSVTVDQSGYDTISWCRGDKVVLDEIRFGATYNDVIDADVVTTPDVAAPAPDPASFATVPTAIDDATVTMTATTAHDPSGVEYLFTETTSGPGATSSGWQDSPTYTDTGLSASTLYTYTVQTRDKSVGQNPSTASAGADVTTPAIDMDPPTPNPITFAVVPAAISDTEISMEAAVATDGTYGVEYKFTNTTLATDSGWQGGTTWTATGLTPNTSYDFTVTARDTGPLNNEGMASPAASASTFPTDNTAPSPIGWDVVPTATSDTEITMTATTATDDQYLVEYYFANLSVINGSQDSGWQASPTYNDTGLSPFQSYTYQLTVRDTSYAQNEATGSILAAVTDPDPAIVTPSLIEGQHYIVASQNNGGFAYNFSVFPGAARYAGTTGTGGAVTSSFGDGTPLDYALFQNSGGPATYAVGAEGFISVPAATGTLASRNDANAWTASDPGDDFTLNPADFTSGTGLQSQGNGDSITGTIDISQMTEGIIYFVYGAYRGSPQIDLTMSGSGQTDITIDNAGDTDFANNQENYVVAINFLNAGDYDTISYTYTSGGSGHRRVITGIVIDGEAVPVVSDYDTWAAGFPLLDLTDPDADLDGDDLTNDEERIFGLDPGNPASQDPFSAFTPAAGTFSFTRRDDGLTGLFSRIETSTDLEMWTKDSGAMLVAGAPDGNDVETVMVTLSPGLLTADKLFVRVVQDDGTILSENFEMSNGGFTVNTTLGTTDWQYGDPDSTGLGGMVTEGNGGSTNCWGTDIGNPGYYADAAGATALRSSVIDLTGIAAAELTFAEALDLQGSPNDSAVVNIIEEATDTIIATMVYTAVDGDGATSAWANVGPLAIPAPALGQKVRLEWAFTGANGVTNSYMGWYIDDVTVQQVTP